MNSKELVSEGMFSFISNSYQELTLCFKLLKVKRGVKRFKGEDYDVDRGAIQYAYAAIAECKQVFIRFLNDQESDVNYSEIFRGKAKIALDLLDEIKKETNFFRYKETFGDILEDLEKATTEFKEIAD